MLARLRVGGALQVGARARLMAAIGSRPTPLNASCARTYNTLNLCMLCNSQHCMMLVSIEYTPTMCIVLLVSVYHSSRHTESTIACKVHMDRWRYDGACPTGRKPERRGVSMLLLDDGTTAGIEALPRIPLIREADEATCSLVRTFFDCTPSRKGWCSCVAPRETVLPKPQVFTNRVKKQAAEDKCRAKIGERCCAGGRCVAKLAHLLPP